MQKVLGDDQSDLALHTKMTCEAAMPVKEQKVKIWHQLTGINEEVIGSPSGSSNAVQSFSIEQLQAKVEGIWQWNQ